MPLRAQSKSTPGVDPDLLALKRVCAVLADNPQDQDSLTALLDYAKNTNGVPRLRSRAMMGCALSALFKGNTNLYVRAQQSHARAYPDDAHLLHVDLSSCYVKCQECGGEGFLKIKCPACEGKGGGKCSACRGKGVRLQRKNLKGSRDAGIKCNVCGGTGRLLCKRCKGAGVIKRRCPKCKGNPVRFSTSPKVYQDFILIVKGITKWINNEDVFYRHYQLARGEENIDKRVAAFKELLANYSYREEKDEVDKLLAADLIVLKERAKGEKVLRDKELREIKLLRGLKDSKNLAASIMTLNEYLEGHPDSEYRLELQSMANNIRDDLKRRTVKRRNFYVFGTIILIILGVSCVHINHYNYNVFSHHKGMDGKEKEEN